MRIGPNNSKRFDPTAIRMRQKQGCAHGGDTGGGGPPVLFRSIPVVEWSPAPSKSGRT